MHHLILLREIDQQLSGSGCCGRFEGDAAWWSGNACAFPERRATMDRIGAIYRAVRHAFPDDVEVTIVDPRNMVSFIPLVIRDAFRNQVPFLTALRTVTSTSVAAGVFDGQILFATRVPDPEEVVETIAGRLRVARVGTA